MSPSATSNPLGFFQDLSIGAIAGFFEVMVTNPLFMIKSALQQKEKNIPYSCPHFLYRGATINALGMIPTTAIQVGLSKTFAKHLDASQMSATFYAGLLSSIVACPVERIMLLQKNKPELNIKHAAQYIGLSKLFVGQTATAIRESGFSMFFLGVTPYVKTLIQDSPTLYTRLLGNNDVYAGVCASILAGGIFAVLSQPIDSIKSYQQSQFKHRIGFFEAQQQLHWQELFHGLTPRSLQIMLSVTVLNTVKEQIEAQIIQQKF